MTLVSLKILNAPQDGVFRVEFSDGSLLSFSSGYLPEDIDIDSLEEGRELTASEEEAFRFAAACYLAETAALRLIARAEQSRLRLAAKLQQKGHDSAAVRAVISRLLDRGLLSDERYSERWVRSRLSQKKTQTPLRLMVSLGKRGIDRNTSTGVLEKTLDPETEYALLLDYLDKIGVCEDKKQNIPRVRLKKEGFSSEVLDRFYDL